MPGKRWPGGLGRAGAIFLIVSSGLLLGTHRRQPSNLWPMPTTTELDLHRMDLLSAAMDFWWMQSLKETPLSLAPKDAGTKRTRPLAFPDTIRRLWIDVGVHKESDFLGHLRNESDLFLLGFEPSDKWKACPHDRCITLWAACTPTYDATVTLNIQGGDDLCNSLLRPQSNTMSKLWKGCVTQLNASDGSQRVINVPGLPLSEVLQRVPDSVVVEFVKIDAQGFDSEVMKGLLDMSSKVQVVTLEAMDVENHDQLLYAGQPLLSDIVDFLAEKGWIHVKSVDNEGVKGEVNAFFVYSETYASKVEYFARVMRQ